MRIVLNPKGPIVRRHPLIFNNYFKRLIFIVININVGFIFRAEAFIKYLNKYIIINNDRILEVL